MRAYPQDSPQSAARIVALTLLADGNLCRRELDALERLQVHGELGLEGGELQHVVHDVCEDLLAEAHLAWADVCRVTPYTLAALLAEVAEPELRRRVLRLCVALAEADGVVDDGEAAVLVAAVQAWGLEREILAGSR